jgi:hypothetical protein
MYEANTEHSKQYKIGYCTALDDARNIVNHLSKELMSLPLDQIEVSEFSLKLLDKINHRVKALQVEQA